MAFFSGSVLRNAVLLGVYTALVVRNAEAVSGWDYKSNVPSNCDGTNILCGSDKWYKVQGAQTCLSVPTSKQSPINIPRVPTDFSAAFPTFYTEGVGSESWEVFTDDHAFEVSFSDSKLHLEYKDEAYYLAQVHFHSPSVT